MPLSTTSDGHNAIRRLYDWSSHSTTQHYPQFYIHTNIQYYSTITRTCVLFRHSLIKWH